MKMKSILLLSAGLLVFGNSFGQTLSTTGTAKYTLMEESTGTWCGYCTDGAQVIEDTLEPRFSRVIIASFHNGDVMTLSPDAYANPTTSGGTGFINSWPEGTVDRAPYAGNIGISRSSWVDATAIRDALTPNFKVSMVCTYDSSTTGATARTITIKVTGKALVSGLSGKWRINAYIVEDSISSGFASTYAQHNYGGAPASGNHFYTSSANKPSWFQTCGNPVSPTSYYAHMNVVRAVLASGANIWGDTAFTNPAISDSVTKTYTYVIPATSPQKYIKVIGLVEKYGTTETDRPIENAVMARVRTMYKVYTPPPAAGVAEIPAPMENIEITPNPASNYIHVEGDLAMPSTTNVTIVNALGQIVYKTEFPEAGSMFSEYIPLTNFSNGMYFMNIANNGAGVTRQFMVNK